jgi:hypothetical protein
MNKYIINAFVAIEVNAETKEEALDKAYDKIFDSPIRPGELKFYIEEIESNIEEGIDEDKRIQNR